MVAVSLKKIFFKQKTAYEITYGDWSSDVCSSDLGAVSAVFRLDREDSEKIRNLDDLDFAGVYDF